VCVCVCGVVERARGWAVWCVWAGRRMHGVVRACTIGVPGAAQWLSIVHAPLSPPKRGVVDKHIRLGVLLGRLGGAVCGMHECVCVCCVAVGLVGVLHVRALRCQADARCRAMPPAMHADGRQPFTRLPTHLPYTGMAISSSPKNTF
jgi:hypothetical protein